MGLEDSRAEGSSPLARGLRRGAAPLPPREGIIPARAGFTAIHSSTLPCTGDHPRSRGVYPEQVLFYSVNAGSSPLARGLLPDRFRCVQVDRIIPARAGFTPRRGRGGRWWRDHPRSRGVYRTGRCTTATSWGSSPLARGLRAAGTAVGVGPGIIPARAGFTESSICTITRPMDHPRSRGVYDAPSQIGRECGGSSPLARGLP